MTTLAIRPTRHAASTLPVLVEALVALVYLLCTVVLEHRRALERVSTRVNRSGGRELDGRTWDEYPAVAS